MHHHHHHNAPSSNKAFLIGATINVAYVIVEATFGFLSNSLSLLADAGHNFSDVLILLLAWGANILASVKPTDSHTYGYRRATILAALTSGLTLVVTMAFIAIEAIQRLDKLIEPDSLTIIVVASIGIVINFITAALFVNHKDDDLNVKGAFLHMIVDGIVSVAVVVGGIVIYFTSWTMIDPILSLLIIIVIAVSAWGLIKDSFNLSVDGVPNNIDTELVRKYLLSLPDVIEIHDLHIWAMSTTQVALTAHLLRQSEKVDDNLLHQAASELKEKYGIHHATIQIENGHCNLECQN
ncbi:MAG: cation diffusion facilitator family transporter [Gammaproteobacteria bacterium]|nr:cation diffusion facilitator family transporter [Gammaproteobacteria bacterium]